MTYPHFSTSVIRFAPTVWSITTWTTIRSTAPRHADSVGRLELKAVREADMTVCVSLAPCGIPPSCRPRGRRQDPPHAPRRTDRLSRRRAPRPPLPRSRGGSPTCRARPLLGLRRHARRAGRLAAPDPARRGRAVGVRRACGQDRAGPACEWRACRERCLALPNVHLIGWQPQAAIAGSPGVRRSV